MTATLRPPDHRRSRTHTTILVAALALAITTGAWLLGTALAPTASDAAAARDDAYEQAYVAARADAYEPAYAAAWRRAFAAGAADGRREGAAAAAKASAGAGAAGDAS